MPEAYVVGGDREPGPVRLRNPLGHGPHQLREVLRAAEDARFRVEPVARPHKRGRVLCQLHQPAYTGERHCAGIPLRLLVAHCGQQAPVELVTCRSFTKPLQVARQPASDVRHEVSRQQVVEPLAIAVIALEHSVHDAVRTRCGEERIDPVEQALVVPVRVHDPGDRPLWREVERDREIRMDQPVQRELRRTGERVLDRSPRDVREYLLGIRIAALDPDELWILRPEVFERTLVGAAVGDLDLPAGRCPKRGGAGRPPAVDQVLAQQVVPRAEGRGCRQLDARAQAGRGQVGASGRHFVDGGLPGAHGVEPQLHVELLREPARELVGRSLRSVAAQIVGVRAVARDHPQLAGRDDPFQDRRWLRAGGKQQRGDQCDQRSHGAVVGTRFLPATRSTARGEAGAGCYRIRGCRRGTEVVITAPTRNRMGA